MQLGAFRRERVVEYDAGAYDFAGVVARVLQVERSELATLHTLPRSREVLQRCSRRTARKTNTKALREPWGSLFDAEQAAHNDRRVGFDALFHRFVREVIEPAVVAEAGAAAAPLYYERRAMLRLNLPFADRTGIGMHCDAEFGHPVTELNFWVPLTDAFGSNSLWVESAPMKGDFRPVTLKVGQMLRFWGNQCRHFNQPNATASTRVSFDFRVLLYNTWLPHTAVVRLPPRMLPARKRVRHKLGGFFACTDEAAARGKGGQCATDPEAGSAPRAETAAEQLGRRQVPGLQEAEAAAEAEAMEAAIGRIEAAAAANTGEGNTAVCPNEQPSAGKGRA